jgi:hypothetical protein
MSMLGWSHSSWPLACALPPHWPMRSNSCTSGASLPPCAWSDWALPNDSTGNMARNSVLPLARWLFLNLWSQMIRSNTGHQYPNLLHATYLLLLSYIYQSTHEITKKAKSVRDLSSLKFVQIFRHDLSTHMYLHFETETLDNDGAVKHTTQWKTIYIFVSVSSCGQAASCARSAQVCMHHCGFAEGNEHSWNTTYQ